MYPTCRLAGVGRGIVAMHTYGHPLLLEEASRIFYLLCQISLRYSIVLWTNSFLALSGIFTIQRRVCKLEKAGNCWPRSLELRGRS